MAHLYTYIDTYICIYICMFMFFPGTSAVTTSTWELHVEDTLLRLFLFLVAWQFKRFKPG